MCNATNMWLHSMVVDWTFHCDVKTIFASLSLEDLWYGYGLTSWIEDFLSLFFASHEKCRFIREREIFFQSSAKLSVKPDGCQFILVSCLYFWLWHSYTFREIQKHQAEQNVSEFCIYATQDTQSFFSFKEIACRPHCSNKCLEMTHGSNQFE